MLDASEPTQDHSLAQGELAFDLAKGAAFLADALGREAADRFEQCAGVLFPDRQTLMLDEAGLVALCWLTDHPNIDTALALFAGMRLNRVSLSGSGGVFVLDPETAAREPHLQNLLAPAPAIAAGLLIRLGAQPAQNILAQGLMIREDQSGASGVDVDLLVEGVAVRLSYGASIDGALIISWRGVVGTAAASLGEAARKPPAEVPQASAAEAQMVGA